MYSASTDALIKEFNPAGIFYYQQPADLTKRGSAFDWPRLSVVPGQGPDGVSSISHWIGPLRLNVDAVFDVFEHGCHNDILGGISLVLGGMYISMQLFRFNTPMSPYDEGVRWAQLKKSSEEIQSRSPNMIPFWRDMVDEMLHEPAGRHCLESSDPELALHTHLKESNCTTKKGTKVIKGRYLSLVRKTREELEWPGQRKFFYTNACLELDALGTAKFSKLVMSGVNFNKMNSTSSSRETDEEENLRKACANQLVVGLMDWCHPETIRNDKLLVASATPWEQWMGKTSKEIRSTEVSAPFFATAA